MRKRGIREAEKVLVKFEGSGQGGIKPDGVAGGFAEFLTSGGS